MSQVDINDSNIHRNAMIVKESRLKHLRFISDLVYFNCRTLYSFTKSGSLPGVIRFTKKRDAVILREEVPIRDALFVKLQ